MSPVTSTFVDVGDARYARHSWRPSRGLQRVVWSSMKDRCCPERGRGCVRMGQCGYIKPCMGHALWRSPPRVTYIRQQSNASRILTLQISGIDPCRLAVSLFDYNYSHLFLYVPPPQMLLSPLPRPNAAYF
jgi:hypothetical protein